MWSHEAACNINQWLYLVAFTVRLNITISVNNKLGYIESVLGHLIYSKSIESKFSS